MLACSVNISYISTIVTGRGLKVLNPTQGWGRRGAGDLCRHGHPIKYISQQVSRTTSTNVRLQGDQEIAGMPLK